MANSSLQTEIAKKLNFAADHSALSLKSQSLVRRLTIAARSLESQILKERGIRSDQLALQRLERELTDQKHENDNLLMKLQEAENKISELMHVSEGLKKESQEQILQLREKVEELQKQEKEKEEEIAKLMVQMEELNGAIVEFQKKSREQIEKAVQKGEIFSQIQERFSDALNLLEDRLKMGVEEPPMFQNNLQTEVPPTVLKEMAFSSPPASEEVPVAEPKENFFQRFIRWWKEPVTTIHLFSKNPGN